MVILLTNGDYYITHNKTGAVIKVSDVEQAQNFYTVERVITQKKKTPRKCDFYYYIDTDKIEEEAMIKGIGRETGGVEKQKKFSNQEDFLFIKKTDGHCYLCEEFVEFVFFK